MYRSFSKAAEVLPGLQAIDYYLANHLCRILGLEDQINYTLDWHLVAALSTGLQEGHSCLYPGSLAGQRLWVLPESQDEIQGSTGYRFPAEEALTRRIADWQITPEDGQPVVWDGERLYLRRYWQYEQELANLIQLRLTARNGVEIDNEKAATLIGQLFNESGTPDGDPTSGSETQVDWQRVAVGNALIRKFFILSGGPGTGKTYTALRLLVALNELSTTPPKILLAAPTGKAAQRLSESIRTGKEGLIKKGFSQSRLECLPDEAATLHRTLGYRPMSLNWKFGPHRRLPCDVLLIDEVSMVDLAMMTRVMKALPPHASVILLGDVDQLPSVDTGSLLADLACRAHPGYPAEDAALISRLTLQPLEPGHPGGYGHLTLLTKSHRFGGEIGDLATMVISADESSWEFVKARCCENATVFENEGVSFHEDTHYKEWLSYTAKQAFLPISRSGSLDEAFDLLSRFRILTPNRSGERGVVTMNHDIEEILSHTHSRLRPGSHYKGRPIMVVENSYKMKLFNGDVGLIWPDESGRLWARFEAGLDEEGKRTFRKISVLRLPQVETVYAMTIHKTQGSEFRHVALVLPEKASNLLSPELLYTGITRAKSGLTVIANEEVWKQALRQRAKRASGLADKLGFSP